MSNQKRAVIMRGICGSGKSTTAKWLASIDSSLDDDFWLEDNVLYYGTPSLSWVIQDRAKSGIPMNLTDEGHPVESIIKSAIHSTDQYFINKDGVYKFSSDRLGLNHNANYKAFRDSIDREIQLVIVDNTNTLYKESKKYVECALESGYWVSYHVMHHPSLDEAEERNIHKVPRDKIKEMITRFQ
jgi:tRNA uridine 5-carbamoylmethylation protein Kti12